MHPFIGKFIVMYVDKIMIYSKHEREYLNHLQQLVKVLQENKLYINLKNY